MKNSILRLPALTIMFLIIATGTEAQNVLTLIASKDNTIFSEATGNSNGSGSYLFTGTTATMANRRALVYFNLKDAVPAGAQIDSAFLRLTVNKGLLGSPTPVKIHRLTKTWGEAGSNAPAEEGKGTAALTGDATWIHNLFESETWGTPGGDFEGDASSVTSITVDGTYTWSGAGLLADVNLWLGDETKNNGWVLIGEEGVLKSAKRYLSRENPDEQHRPSLTLYYGDPSTAGVSMAGSGTEHLRAFPNPFREEVTIACMVNEGGIVHIAVYNLLGQQLSMISKSYFSPGSYRFTWDGKDRAGNEAPAGMYYLIRHDGDERQVLKIMKSR